ncbi:sensor histidine kinase [Mucilaginibacter gilvus]|uniref:ATP-binding protein n=1 Tax=Mucilaginibacter gilvus TaxID=2305909 RepID=A0A3S3YPK3_9SPHI|nr:ATP-binding protein [Mucilaginibacter gilvus]RWY47475.1 ATP-binding protein [Mucilaginibacter gilvus]
MADELEFRISSGLKNIIGKDLITDDFIAVFELVKNSYDAHADKVSITFEDDKIIILDTGKGMSLQDIKEKWLFVAYSAKRDGEEDEEFEDLNSDYREKIKAKRYYAGAKGIGRFSCDRLGLSLVLTTKKIGENSIEQLKIDWGKFEEDSKEEFVNIKVDHDTLDKYPLLKIENGTVLEIMGLQTPWPRQKLQNLKYSLEKLINPFGSLDKKNNDPFSIDITCKREEKADLKEEFLRDRINGRIENFIFETLNVKTTQIKTIIKKDWITTILIDRGTPIYEIREQNKKYSLLEDVIFHLFFLNTSAKNNFSRQMGLQPVNFGSVFLFKNGFRVYPFGNSGDDSLGIDQRHQQKFKGRLGSRDLLGRIELFTDNSPQFKEVSSRDGGLVETEGYSQLIASFYDKCLKRLERYVVDVQWAYSIDSNLREDKESDDISVISKSVGGRYLLGDIIKKLADNKDVEILSYNKDLVNIINEKLDNIPPEVFRDLTKIADKTNDQDFKDQISQAEKKYNTLLKEKEDALRRAIEEEELRIKAQEDARKAEEARKIEEDRRKKADEARKLAEIEAKEKELQRREEEIKRKEAEQRAAEAQKAKVTAETSLKYEKDKNTYLNATRKTLSDDAEELIHSIKVSAIGIDASLEALIRKIASGLKDDAVLLEEISHIKFIVEKVMKLSKLITKSNFKADQENKKVNVVEFVSEYITTYSFAYQDKIKIEFKSTSEFITRLSLLDLSIVIDNLISNSVKANADQILIEAIVKGSQLILSFSDNGKGVAEDFVNNPNLLFQLGSKTDVEGSGIGLYSVKRKMGEMYGDVRFAGNGKQLKGATFNLIFN